MELQWPLILFTTLLAWAAGLFAAQCVWALRGKGARAQMPALITSAVLLVVGGIAVFFHLEHWERIFNGFGNPTSGITQELACIVVVGVLMVVAFVMLRRGAGDGAAAGAANGEAGRAAGDDGAPALPKWLAALMIAAAALLVLVTGHSYMMAARPAWDSPLGPLTLLGAACEEASSREEKLRQAYDYIRDNYRYLSDLLSYVAVGARSVENQEHRLTSSGIDIPVGMKNPTSGDISVMLNSIMAAQHPHTFIYRGWEVDTTGNPLAHAILRGYVNKHGESMPNYHFEELERLYNAYTAKGLQNMALIVDANHANSGKKYQEQPRICKEVLHSCRHSGEIKSMVKGFMVESYLEPGCQKIGDGVYGKSITDPCLGWEETIRLVQDIADLI